MTQSTSNETKSVFVYRRNFLPVSETFIDDHIKSLRRYRATVVCREKLTVAPEKSNELIEIRGRIREYSFKELGYSPILQKAIVRHKPKLIHAHFLTDAADISLFCVKNKIPLMVTAHGYDATLTDQSLLQFPEGRFYLQRRELIKTSAARIICVSEWIRSYLIDAGFPPDRLITQPLGVRLDEEVGGTNELDRSGVVTVGRLVEKKGTRYLLEAWAKLPHKFRNVPLRIIGDGPLRRELEAKAAELNLKVDFLGALSHKEALDAIRSSRVFVFPSVRAANGDAEGMGIAVMEALASRTPVVIFDDQPIAQYIKNYENGLVVRTRDTDDLSHAISLILGDELLANKLSAAGRILAEESFSLKKNTEFLEDIYDSV